MSQEITLASVEHEYKRWEVRLAWPTEGVGLSAGTWASTGPNREHTYGMTVMAPTPAHFRQMAAALIEAAETIEHDIANPSEPVEDLYREALRVMAATSENEGQAAETPYRFTIRWDEGDRYRNGAYRVDRPNYNGGEVVDAEHYDTLCEHLQKAEGTGGRLVSALASILRLTYDDRLPDDFVDQVRSICATTGTGSAR